MALWRPCILLNKAMAERLTVTTAAAIVATYTYRQQ
jgi:hypothetical protein